MPVEAEWERCLPNDPRRCQASGIRGQCPYKAKPDTNYCPRHNATADQLAARRAANRYRLGQYQERFTDFTVDSEIKNLRSEIGILRMTLEEVINSCQGDSMKLICNAGKISDMVSKVQKLVVSCQRLEVSMGLMLDRDKVILIGQKIVELVSNIVPDKEILDQFGEALIDIIYKVTDPSFRPN